MNIETYDSPLNKPTSRQAHKPNPEYAPISAASYFEQAVEVTVPASQLAFRVYYSPPAAEDGTVMVCHHGAGYSSLSFACFAEEVTTMTQGECGILALDARRHGIYLFNYAT